MIDQAQPRTHRLRGGPADGEVIRLTKPRPRWDVAVMSPLDLRAWTGAAVSAIDAAVEVERYERVTFVNARGERFFRYYHPSHPEYAMIQAGTWNEWWRARILRHVAQRANRYGRGYTLLVMAATVRAFTETN